jgi:plasmid maintenance system killer protein
VDKEARKVIGKNAEKKLKQRLTELKAADVLSDISHLPPSRLHELTGNRSGIFSVDLEHPYRLLFMVANNPVPLKEDGGIDKRSVTEVEIVEIADTH